jgi:hypothetical protein
MWATAGDAMDVALPTDKLKLSISGFGYGAAHVDTNGTASRPWLAVVTGGAPGVTSFEPFASRLNITAQTTELGAATATETERPRGMAVTEIDWLPAGVVGNAASGFLGPRIRLMYVQLDVPAADLSLVVGQNWSLLGAGNVDTYDINWFLRQGNPYARTPGLQLSKHFGLVSVSLGASGSSVAGFGGAAGVAAAATTTAVGAYAAVDGPAPAGEARVAIKLFEKGWVALAGGLGQIWATSTLGPSINALRWIGVLDFSVPVKTLFSVSGKAFVASGGGYGVGIGQPFVVTLDSAMKPLANPVFSWGGYASAKLTLLAPFYASVYFGFDKPDPQVAGVNVPLQQNLTGGGTLTYTFDPGMQLALEWMHVATSIASRPGHPGIDDRFSLIARYVF